ncbi:MAG: DotA/TraY family protein [Gammaproteobacteria bacterium]
MSKIIFPRFSINKCLMLLGILLVAAFTLCHPVASFADETTSTVTATTASFFDPVVNDQSVVYLGDVFGNVGTVLSGSGSTLMGQLFSIFNSIILALGIIIAGYTTLVGTINTAGEGEMMGKKMHSIWVPVRTVLGIALLIPSGSGYCVIQILMMWIVLQGVGAADELWSTAAKYLSGGGSVAPADVSVSYQKSDDSIENLFLALVCMQSINYYSGNTNSTLPYPTAQPYSNNTKDVSYTYSAEDKNGDTVKCARFLLPIYDTANFPEQQAAIAHNQSIATMSPTLNTVASYFVNYCNNNPDDNDCQKNRIQSTVNLVGDTFVADLEKTYSNYLVSAAALAYDYQYGSSDSDDFWEQGTKYGWVSAGSYFYTAIASSTNYDINVYDGQYTVLEYDSNYKTPSDVDSSHSNTQTDINDAGKLFDDLVELARSSGASTGTESTSALQLTTQGFSNVEKGSKNFQYYMNKLLDSISKCMQSFQQSIANSDGKNPVVNAHLLGRDLLNLLEQVWSDFMAAFAAAALVSATAGSVMLQIPMLLQTVMTIAMPIMLLWSSFVLMIAGPLDVLLPFLPYIIFTFTAMGWILAVIETMAAAPIAAIGIMHPDGHDFFGKAEPTVMLIANMFLQPSLIIIGFSTAIFMTYVGGYLINFGFNAMLGILFNDYMNVFEACLVLSIYMGLFLATMNKAFSLIHVVPSKVMRWLSGGEMAQFAAGVQEDMQQVKGQFDQGSQATKEGISQGSQALQAGNQSLDKFGYEKRQDKKQEERDKANQMNSAGDNSTGGGEGTGNTTPSAPQSRNEEQKQNPNAF